MAWWNKNKEDKKEKWEGFSAGERNYGDTSETFTPKGTTSIEDRAPKDRWKAFAADEKESKSNQSKLSREAIKAERERVKKEKDLQFLRDTESKREIEEIGRQRKEQEKAAKKDMKEFKKALKSGATEGEFFKQDMKDLGKDISTDYKTLKRGAKGVLAGIESYAMKREVTGPRIDPLKGLVKKTTTKRKGKRGRPKKYKPVPRSGRPRGKPIDNDFSMGGFKFFNDQGVPDIPREPIVPETPQQRRLIQLFGQKQQFWGYGGNPVRINKRITSGKGLIKNGDGGATGRMFGIRRF